ncbi:metacaspase-1-like [Bidens hawaiensis]|uniref:metacaspase-1-like n=1 Tax=Bidens hawaiensis TaxID=980011 RepID=UPI00404AA046
MKYLLTNKFKFPESSILMLTEEETDPYKIPTKHNMRMALYWLVLGCQPGDSLVFHYSGHGSRQRNYNGDEADGYDETLCPLDHKTQGMIVDDEINATIVRPLPRGVKLHAIVDSCYSGTILDLPFLCRMTQSGHYSWEDHRPKSGLWKGSNGGEVFCISACDDHQKSDDTTVLSKVASTGVMTFCFIQAIEHGHASTYGSLIRSMRNVIPTARGGTLAGGLIQEPQLTTCETFDVYAKPFSL